MVSFEDFKASWLEDIQGGNPSTIELGRRFARKITAQWLDCSDVMTDFYDCDGSADGGIDIALLYTGIDNTADATELSGHTWYLVQSKYRTAFSGVRTLLDEGLKVIETLAGQRSRLNSLSDNVVEKIRHFRNGASSNDKIILVFATESPLNDEQKGFLSDLRTLGRERLGPIFDIEAISIETIFNHIQELDANATAQRLEIELNAELTPSGPDLLVGSIGLLSLYDFLKQYRDKTGDLDSVVNRFKI